MSIFKDIINLLYYFIINFLFYSSLNSENWNFSQWIVIKIITSYFNCAPYISIETFQYMTRFCKNLPFPGLNIESTTVPDKFRDEAYNLIKYYLEGKYGYHVTEPNQHWKYGKPLDIQWTTPKNRQLSEPKSVIYYIHGGGYAIGHSCLYNHHYRDLSEASASQIVAVDYRLGPQFTLSSIIEDVLATYLYLLAPESEGGAGFKSSQIVVGGESAGGGLSTNLIHLLRNNKMPQPAGTFLWSPSTDLTFSQPSMLENNHMDYMWDMKEAISLTREGITLNSGFYWWIYNHSSPEILERIKRDGTPFGPKEAALWPEVSTLFDPNVGYLPPTLIIVSERDSLRDCGIIYGQRRAIAEINGHINKTLIPNIQTVVYEDQVHVHMVLPANKYTNWAVKSTGEFIYQAIHANDRKSLESKTYEYLPDYKTAYMNTTYNIYWETVHGEIKPWNCTYKFSNFPTPEYFNPPVAILAGNSQISPFNGHFLAYQVCHWHKIEF
jgi:acetyl esterase/lipase